MTKAIGSVFELSVRYLLLLYTTGKKSLTESRLCAMDFIVTYSRDFDLASENLHGNSVYRYGEYASRCSMSSAAIKRLVLLGLITVGTNPNGFVYMISETGVDYCSSINSEYADCYCRQAYIVIDHFAQTTDTDLIRTILKKASAYGKEDA